MLAGVTPPPSFDVPELFPPLLLEEQCASATNERKTSGAKSKWDLMTT